MLDNLLIPGLITKFFELFIYFGPKLMTYEEVTVDEFREAMISSIENFRDSTEPGLRNLLAAKNKYSEIIEGVHWWQYNSGTRDPDGHPIGSNEYSP